jgi:16S rRNA pseudouridine516 synthase
MLEQIKAVIFDLDGTLMDSMWLWKDIDIEYLGRYGHALPDTLQLEIEGMGFTETAAYFKQTFDLPDSIEEIKAEWNRMARDKYAHQVKMKPGASDFLKKLQSEHIRTAIASSNSRELIMCCLENNKIAQAFDCIMTSCDVEHGKPFPDIYLSTAKQLGVSPQECLVFEDVPMGILAGKRAGMKVCAVEDAHALDQIDTIRQLADYYIRSYDEVWR